MNEKYIPLYRKYRPQILEEVVGQEHVKKALANAIALNKISHAYLFTGPRGTGKTSTARILAKSLNCVEGPTVKPCGKCPSCLDIINSTPIDVIEIDAASNRSVNDAQNILEKIQYAPVNGKYKIYIIDEVHMLTVQAFNALLKTLEEPPENVVFILATTEVHKVLDTIKSRCQRFDFKRITTDDIAKHLKHIAELEKINIEDDAILTIAKNAAGGMRDSLALLDQLSVLDTEKAITTDDINTLLGRLSFDVLNSLSEAILACDPNRAIEILEGIYNSGNEPSQILLNLLNYFKNLLVAKNCNSDLVLELTQTTDAQFKILKEQSEKLETHQIVFLIERTSHYINELKLTTNQHTWLEVAMIDLANLTENTKLIELQSRLQRLETSDTQHVSVQNYKTPPHPVQKPSMKPAGAGLGLNNTPIAKQQPHVEEITKPQATPQEASAELKEQPSEDFSPMPMSSSNAPNTNDLNEAWKALLNNVTSVGTKALLMQLAKPVQITPESVVITIKQESFVKQWNESTKKQTVIDAVDKLFSQKNSNVTIRLPQPSDDQIRKKTSSAVSMPETKHEEVQPQKEVVEEPQIHTPPAENKPKEIEVTSSPEKMYKSTENPDMVEVVLDVENESKSKTETAVMSDQVKMIKDLFEGKLVE